MSAISTPGNTSNRAYHYEPKFETRKYTLLEAIDQVTRGFLAPMEIYRQMPDSLKKEIDTLANLKINSSFSQLSITDQCDAFKKLMNRINGLQAIEALLGNVTPFEALKKAQLGEIDDLLLLNYLPAQLKEILDELSKHLFKNEFEFLQIRERQETIKALMTFFENAGSADENDDGESNNSNEFVKDEKSSIPIIQSEKQFNHSENVPLKIHQTNKSDNLKNGNSISHKSSKQKNYSIEKFFKSLFKK